MAAVEVLSIVVPFSIVNVPVPKAPALLISKVPALKVTPPLKVLLPLKARVPEALFMMTVSPLPAMMPLKVLLLELV